MGLRQYLEADLIDGAHADDENVQHTLRTRLRYGIDEAVSVIRQIWVWVVVGVAIGAFIHNYVPQESIHKLMQATGTFRADRHRDRCPDVR